MFEKAKSDPEVQELIRMREEAEIEMGNKIAAGKAEERREIAKKMLVKGMDINDISELSGLSIDEVKKLK